MIERSKSADKLAGTFLTTILLMRHCKVATSILSAEFWRTSVELAKGLGRAKA